MIAILFEFKSSKPKKLLQFLSIMGSIWFHAILFESKGNTGTDGIFSLNHQVEVIQNDTTTKPLLI